MNFTCNTIVDRDSNHVDPILIGGKAANLILLARRGYSVPPFFVISANAFREHVAALPAISRLINEITSHSAASIPEAARHLRSEITKCEVPDRLVEDIRKTCHRLISPGAFMAVRSSACDEDGADHSFAGMHDSFLYVSNPDAVIEKVKQVWASAFNERAIAYRIENQLDVQQIAVAVVIQEMIDAQASGVIFTCNPANNRTDQLVISSLFGAGEGLVSAGLAADTYTVGKRELDVESEIVEKTEQLLVNHSSGGLVSRPVDDAQANVSSLSNSNIREAAQQAIDIENFYRRPQDIEFCIDQDGQLFILQARPITRIDDYGPAAGNRLVWDNSNIIESYSGVTSPMTFSFIRRAYTIVYYCFAQVMGISESRVKDSRHVFENMLGLLRGRVYYNLQNWYRLIRLFPGFQYNAQFMESMMGLKEPLVLDDPVPRAGFWRKWFVEFPALIRLVVRTGWNFLRIKSIVNQFQTSFREHYDRWDAMDFDQMAPHDLKSLYHEMEDALLWNWKAPIINDFYVMIYYGLLKRFSQKWVGDETGALQNDLICGEGGVESAEPAKMLLKLASLASDQPPLRDEIMRDPIETVPDRVISNTEFQSFTDLMRQYLNLYGFRCMNELKLEEFSLRDKPHVVYQVLRNYLALDDQSVLDVDAMNHREQSIRHEAERTVRGELRGPFALFKRLAFNRVLRNARMGVKNRENMRFARTRIYGLLREILRALGTQLAAESIIDDREDIFYLTIDEVWDYLKGTAVTTSLRELAQLRRVEFDRYRSESSPDDRFETFGFVYHKNSFTTPGREIAPLEDGQLRGIGCCPGEVTENVRVVLSPSDNLSLSGEILVAERTDPGWVPLYPAVSGILIERGSILSHSAVVAREMGIPTIVGINGLLAHVNDGDTVHMDGSSGIARILPQGEDEPVADS